MVWKLNKDPFPNQINVEVLDKNANPIGEKSFYNIPTEKYLNLWIERPRANKTVVVPLKNGISPYTSNSRVSNWSDDALGYVYCGGNDIQHATQQTVIFSSTYGGGNGFYLTPENLWQAAIVFTVRRIIKPIWLNDRDQFLQPDQPLTAEFKADCLVWMLFNGSNLTASADNLEWQGKKWSIVNHFIPFTESEVNSNGRFESDFMVRYLADNEVSKNLSEEAKHVLEEGKKLWQAYFSQTDVHSVRDALKLNRSDVGWYQVRKAVQARNASGDFAEVSFRDFEAAYKALTEKLRPMVFELGFLRG